MPTRTTKISPEHIRTRTLMDICNIKKEKIFKSPYKPVPRGFWTGIIAFCVLFFFPSPESHGANMVNPAGRNVVIGIFQSREALSGEFVQKLHQIRKECGNRIFPIVFPAAYPWTNSEINCFPRAMPTQMPAVVIHGDAIVYPGQGGNWTQNVCKAVNRAYTGPRRRLSLYISAKKDRDGTSKVFMDVCNMEEKRSFSGKSVLLLLKMKTLKQGNLKTFFAVRNIAERKLYLKPQETQRSCPLPDQVTIKPEELSGEYTFFLMVLDSAGKIQSIAWEGMESRGATDDL